MYIKIVTLGVGRTYYVDSYSIVIQAQVAAGML